MRTIKFSRFGSFSSGLSVGGLLASRQAKARRFEGEIAFMMVRAAQSPLSQMRSKSAGLHGPISAGALPDVSADANRATALAVTHRWAIANIQSAGSLS
jgi:hypothetical protein